MTEGGGDLAAFFDLIDYAYFVVTVRSPEGEMSGCLAGFVTQCSIDPPNFLVCISKVNHTFGVAAGAPGMGLHLLGRDQVDLARLFGEESGDVVDKFASVDWRLGSTGAPLFSAVSALPFSANLDTAAIAPSLINSLRSNIPPYRYTCGMKFCS